MLRPLLATFALFAVVLAVALARYAPPAPLETAPVERFSAARAREVQAALVGDGSTRFVGTEGNRRAQTALTRAVEVLGHGLQLEPQTATACTHHGMCAPVTNLVAKLPGREPALPGVLLSAHYDSVLAGPGASDDALGVATVLETLRALANGPPPKRTVVVLLADGEEAGLLGADAFARGHPLAGTVRTTVNVDARGSRGPSQMFETSRGNWPLVTRMASHLDRPVTTSLFYEVYKRMPNDTDFTITKTLAAGVNFANTDGIEHYHTPLDSLATSDLGTLQHHGDHVLAMARAFAEAEAFGERDDAGKDAVWFDVLALGIVYWPAGWTPLIALVALAMVAAHAFRARAKDRGLLVFLPTLALGAAAAFAVGWVLRRTGALPAVWVAHPTGALVAVHAAAAAAAVGTVAALARRSVPRALWAGVWLGWGMAGAALAVFAPGMSYLFIVPTLAAALSGSFSPAVATMVPAGVASVLVLALGTSIYGALGFAAAPLIALPPILLTTTLAPMLPGLPPRLFKLAPAGLAVLSLVGAITAFAVPKFAPSHPQRVNVLFRQDVSGARAYVDTSWGPSSWGSPPATMLEAAGAGTSADPALPWTWPARYGVVPPIDAALPRADVLSTSTEGGRRLVRARIVSPRDAPTIALVLPPDRAVTLKVGGRFASPRPLPRGKLVGLLAVPPGGIEVELDAPGAEPIGLGLLDRTIGLPPGSKAEAAARARPPEAVPFQDGDVTVLVARVSL